MRIVKSNESFSSDDYQRLAVEGFKFVLSFGEACAEPRPSLGYFCKTIEDARVAYASHKGEGYLFSLKTVGTHVYDVETIASGVVR